MQFKLNETYWTGDGAFILKYELLIPDVPWSTALLRCRYGNILFTSSALWLLEENYMEPEFTL